MTLKRAPKPPTVPSSPAAAAAAAAADADEDVETSSASDEESLPSAAAAVGASSSPAKKPLVAVLAVSAQPNPSVGTKSQPPPLSADEMDSSSENEDAAEESDADSSGKESPLPEGKPQPEASTDDSSDSSSSEDSGNTIAPCPSRADPSVKPISSRPMRRFPSPASPPSSKRKLKGSPARENGSTKRWKQTDRVWSDTSDLTILRGLLSFHKSQRTPPSSHLNLDELYKFLKKGVLNSEFSKEQLRNKLKRLRQTYGSSAALVKHKPNTPELELGRKIWGQQKRDRELADTKLVDVSRNRALRTRHAKASRDVPSVEIINDTEMNILVCNKSGDLVLPNLMDLLVKEDRVSISTDSARAAVDSMDRSVVAAFNQKLMDHTLSSVKHHIKSLEIRKEAMELYAKVISRSLNQPSDLE